MKTVNYSEKVTLFNDQDEMEVKEYIHQIVTDQKIPKLGVMLVGLGGNNGSTMVAGILANKNKLQWETKEGMQNANYLGSFTQSSSMKVGYRLSEDNKLNDVYKTVKDVVPLVNPNDIVITGWDISGMDLYQSCKRAKVLEPALLNQMKDELSAIKPMKAVYTQRYVASNQIDRADNVFEGTNQQKIDKIRADIRDFKQKVDKVILLWTANTEETVEDIVDVHVLRKMIDSNQELQGSVLYAISAIEENVVYLNGSPQNTFHTAILEMARENKCYIGGSDFKSGQTRYKTVMGDFLSGAGIKLASVVSYNHLGNNDGKNLQESHTFKSKEMSKAGVLDDMINNNKEMYGYDGGEIDHTVVIKYQPFVGDSKRAMDEYISLIFMNGRNTITSYNVCEDSLLAVPIMIDMILLSEYFTRITINGQQLGPVLSYLSFFFKAPYTNRNEYVVNSFNRQREILNSFLKATAGYIQEDNSLIQFQF